VCDSVKSFVKRRVGIAPGAPWIPFDQLDFVIGALRRGRLWNDGHGFGLVIERP
jgi:hypothetical protein